MKSNMKKRMIALMLCMVMLLSGSTSALADDANAEMNTVETVQEVQAEPAALSEEPAQPETAGEPEATVEATVAAPTETETAGGEADAPQATETAPEAAVTEDTPQTAAETAPEAAVTEDTPQTAAETTPHQDAMELTQEMKDADGNTVCTVKAEIPEGTFQANTSEVTMEVTDVDEPIEKEIKELMKKKLPDGKELGHYFLYNVSFKVNGQTTEPGREIKITFDKKDFRIEDVKKANVFYYNEANSPMGNTEAEIIEIIQKADKIEELQKAGESADNIDDYDLSEISLKADGTADKIQTEGRRSTVYGCYIEKGKPEETGDTAESAVDDTFETFSSRAADAEVEVTDDIINSGNLVAAVSPELQERIDNADTVSYTWYKKIDHGAFEKVGRIKVGNNYNIAEDGKSLNVPLDDGALSSAQSSVLYKLQITVGDTTYESGEYSVSYYKELRNGSFENPQVPKDDGKGNTAACNYQYGNDESPAMIWKSTGVAWSSYFGKDTAIELLRPSNNTVGTGSSYAWQNDQTPAAADGEQFAELNCEAAGALYQDVLTIPGTELNYWFSHRARGTDRRRTESDSMYVVIVPSSLAIKGIHDDDNPIDTQDEVEQLIRESARYDGVQVRDFTSDDQSWHNYGFGNDKLTYTPTSSLTRFFFVAGATASGNNTQGNFLDNVGFSQDLPPAEDGSFTLQVKKTVSGLTYDKAEELAKTLKFTITAEDEQGKEAKDAPLNGEELKVDSEKDWTYNSSDGTFTYTWAFENQKIDGNAKYIYTVTESGEMVDDTEPTTNLNVSGGTIQSDKKSTLIGEKDSATFAFTNSYSGLIDDKEESATKEGSITKEMAAPAEDGKYPIDLTVKTRLETISENAKVDVILVIDKSGSMDDNDRLEHTKTAAKAFVNGFVGVDGTTSSTHRVGIVTFSDSAQTINFGANGQSQIHFSGDVNSIKRKIDSINAKGGTNTEAGFAKAEELAKETQNRTYVILLTDGVPTYHITGDGYAGGGGHTTKEDFNQAVDAALILGKEVEGIYTIGLLNGMSGKENDLDIARRLLASSNPRHQVTNYTCVYKLEKGQNSSNGSVMWARTTEYNYSDGYFEVTSTADAQDKLKDIWENLANIINNSTDGSTGDGWKVTDQMADDVTFKSLSGASVNGYELKLSDDGRIATTEIDGEKVIVATYDENNKTITWNLNSKLATATKVSKTITDYTYRLRYYVTFEDSGNTEFRKTNNVTYVEKTEDKEKLYPPTMPFFVNVVGDKIDSDSLETTLSGAEFEVYRDGICKNKIGGTVTADSNGHFAFQVGQTDMTKAPDRENYSMTVYLKETKAPADYEQDETVYPITIAVPNVTYDTQGVPTGTASISYAEDENSMLSIDGTTLKLKFKNEKNTADLDLKKTGTDYGVYLEGAVFELYQKDSGDSWKEVERKTAITVNNEDNQIELRKLPSGIYKLEETNAPSGYYLLKESIFFKVDKGVVALTDKDGGTLQENPDMWKLETENGNVLTIKNDTLYSLPSAGGPGVHWYMIGGVLLMLAAALILYRNRCKEVQSR